MKKVNKTLLFFSLGNLRKSLAYTNMGLCWIYCSYLFQIKNNLNNYYTNKVYIHFHLLN